MTALFFMECRFVMMIPPCLIAGERTNNLQDCRIKRCRQAHPPVPAPQASPLGDGCSCSCCRSKSRWLGGGDLACGQMANVDQRGLAMRRLEGCGARRRLGRVAD